MAGHRRHRSAPLGSTLTEQSSASALRFYVRALAVAQIATGVGYLFNAPASAPSLVLMQTFLPIPVWGGALVVGGVLLLTRQFAFGHGICFVVCFPWAIFAVVVLLNGTATGWGWGWPGGLAVIHGYSLLRTTWARRAATLQRDSGG